jgi:TonB family protein
MRSTTFAISWIVIFLCFGLAQTTAQTPSSQGTDSNTKETADKVYRVGVDGVTPPHATYMPDPEYSEEARNMGHGGTCVLTLVVDAKGMPRDITVKKSLGMGLDEKSIETVRRWRFKPATKNGVPVAVQINVELTFHIFDSLEDKLVKADAGDANAQFEVSQALLSGRNVPKDESRGFAYLEKAAKQGLPQAQFAMGDYLSSHGNDLVTAYVWYALAHRNRYQHSDKRMKQLAKKMTPDQLTEARRRVDSKNPI